MDITRVFDIHENAFQQFPDKQDMLACKIDGEWKKYSTADYYHTAKNVSYGLLALGLERGDKILTVSNNRPEWNFIDMGMTQAGMIHVPVYPTLSESDYKYILEHAEPKMIFVSDKNLLAKLQAATQGMKNIKDIYTYNDIPGAKNWKEVHDLGEKEADKYKDKLESIRASIKPDDMLTIIYTSGTTGNPKGVMLSHRNIISNLEGIMKIYHFGIKDRGLSFLPISHIFERTINYYFQRVGVSIYYAQNLGTIGENLKEVKPTIFIVVPRVLEGIYDKIIGIGKNLKGIKKQIFFWAVNLGLRFEHERVNGWFYHKKLALADKLIFSKWRLALGGECDLVVSGSAALQPRLIRVFNAAGIPLVEGYGMTENSPVISANINIPGGQMIGTVGPALPGTEVKIAEDGEIQCKGDSVMLGYYKEEAMTKEAIDEEGWLHTGDVGTIIDNKFIKITDRKKEIFKLSSGKYIAPQVIENIFKESFFIEQLMVVGENEKFASALIVPNFIFLHNWCSRHNVIFQDNDHLITRPKVIARYQQEVNEMNKKLGQTEHIKRFRLIADEWTVESGLLSPTLKVRRKVIAERYKDVLGEIYSVQKGD